MASPAKKTKLNQTAAKKHCPYGAACYRKNPAHFVEFSHPNDANPSDTGTCSTSVVAKDRATKVTAPAKQTSSLPPCKYGAHCYRKNLMHFAEYSHPTVPSSSQDLTADSDSGDTDVCESDDDKDKKDKGKAGNDLFNRGMSLVKSFTKMTEQERKDLIRMAFEAKEKLQAELEATKKVVEEKDKELSRMQEQINKGVLFVEGEQEAMEGDKTVFFTLLPERIYKEGSADQIHFRLAESQFYRLLIGEEVDNYRVTKVQYVVTPHLVKRFKGAREKLKQSRGEEMSYPVLGFHGTDDVNITPICETGFRMPGDSGFVEKTDAGWYGAGIYFSEYPAYSMDYIQGAERLLLCQVLPGKVYDCTEINEGSKLQKGYDSHMSPDKKELVIFNAHHILPCYIVHYTNPTCDFKYKKALPGMKRIRKVGGPERSDGSLAAKLTKAKKQPASKTFEGKLVLFAAKNLKHENALRDLVKKHKGDKGSEDNFDFLVVSSDIDTENNTVVEKALEKDKPIVTEEFLFECIFHKKFLDPDYFLHELYDQ